MQHVMLRLEYDGSRFKGFQRLPDDGRRSVQRTLERALSAVFRVPVTTRGASRTDTGVHAIDQAVCFRVKSIPFPLHRLTDILNIRFGRGEKGLLVRKAFLVPPDFHPQHHVVSKTYIYAIRRSLNGAALLFNHAWSIPWDLDLEAMKSAARLLTTGPLDFRRFARRIPADTLTVRKLDRLEILEQDEMLLFEYRASGFLRGQVRLITGALVDVGRGRRDEKNIADMLACRRIGAMSHPVLAPAAGLYLAKIDYGLEEEEA